MAGDLPVHHPNHFSHASDCFSDAQPNLGGMGSRDVFGLVAPDVPVLPAILEPRPGRVNLAHNVLFRATRLPADHALYV